MLNSFTLIGKLDRVDDDSIVINVNDNLFHVLVNKNEREYVKSIKSVFVMVRGHLSKRDDKVVCVGDRIVILEAVK